MFNKTFKKIDIIKNLSLKTGFSNNFSKKIIKDLIDIIIKNIKSGKLNLMNTGSFELMKKKARPGRNPRTKEEFIIVARKTVKFNPSQKILKKLNGLYE